MQQHLSWLGGGMGGTVVLLAACLGAAHPASFPVPAPAPALQASIPVEQAIPARQHFAPACPAMHRAGGSCEALGRTPSRLLRT